jgi:hypothetical protein
MRAYNTDDTQSVMVFAVSLRQLYYDQIKPCLSTGTDYLDNFFIMRQILSTYRD